jgi:hypothetical protein
METNGDAMERAEDEREHGTVLPAEGGDADQSDVSDDQDSDDTTEPREGDDDTEGTDDGGTGPD